MKKTNLSALLILIFMCALSVLQAKSYALVDAQEAFLKRTSEYTNSYPVNFTEEESSKIIGKCESIKQKIEKVREGANATTVKREDAYGNIERQLSSIQSRISTQGLDTSVIDLVLASYRIEVSNFKNSADKYSTILSDAISLDCGNNPQGFKSAILAARDARASTVTAMKRIKKNYESSILNGFDLLERQLYER